MKQYFRSFLFISVFIYSCSFSQNQENTQANNPASHDDNQVINKVNQKFEKDSYLVIDLIEGIQAEKYPYHFTNIPPDVNDDKCRTTELWLRKIPAGKFIMGSPEGELGHKADEIQHEVSITKDFYIGIFEFTQKQWELVMGAKETLKEDCKPIEYKSYEKIRGKRHNGGAGWPSYGHAVDSDSFMDIIRKKTGLLFDLPTEAMWEYACRAGTTTALNSGKDLTNDEECPNLNELGRYFGNSKIVKGNSVRATGPQKVGSFKPNAWGLYDMHGNVEEWCLDFYGNYSLENKEDPVGIISDKPLMMKRVTRSSSCVNAQFCRSASRNKRDASMTGMDMSMSGFSGFRIAYYPKPLVQFASVVDTRNFEKATEVEKVEWLIMACKENDPQTIEKLLKSGLTPNCSYNGQSALTIAIKEKSIEAVKMLVKYKVDLKPDDEMSPLQFAIQELRAEQDFDVLFPIVKILVENGADVNADTGFSSVFSNAINMVANLELVKYLYEHGAVITGDGRYTSRNPEVNEYVLQEFKKQDPQKIKQLQEKKKREAEEKRKKDDIIWKF
jgi:formylglycine-generating enzyme required for sulfatase activity